jgi:hypothetical protein
MPYEMLNEELKSKDLFFPVDVSQVALYGESAHSCSDSLALVQKLAV